jgi:hypothetical protein
MELTTLTLYMGQFASLLSNVTQESVVLLYLGPETIMPVGSFLAAALGILLIFWRQTVALARNSLRRVFVRKSEYSKVGNELNMDGQDRSPDGTD